MSEPRLFLTSMSSDPSSENPVEMIEPLLPYLDGVVWCLNDVPPDAPAARYLESVKGVGRIIHRRWTPRHWHLQNETLFTEDIDEGSLVLWADPLERPAVPFVSRIKSEIGPMMAEADVGLILGFGKPYLFRYSETLEYRNSPHWTLTGWQGRAIEWSTIEPDEAKVRVNVRPLKRKGDEYHWCRHYLRYFLEYPAGSNSAALGLDHWPGGQTQENWVKRETNRLALRAEMRKRGYPVTVAGFVLMCADTLDQPLKALLNADKTFIDGYWYMVKGRTDCLRHSHNPADALPIP
jgi:hypothetical protein